MAQWPLSLVFLIYIEPVLAITVAAMFGGVYALVFLAIQRRPSQVGTASVDGNRERFRVVAEAFGALRELRLYGGVQNFIERSEAPAGAYYTANATGLIIGQMPRFILEPLAFASIVFIARHRSRSDRSSSS